MSSPAKKSIFEYDNFREYLKDEFKARKEKNQRMVVREVERPKFELWAAKECLKEWRRQEKEKQPKTRRREWLPEYDDIPWYE